MFNFKRILKNEENFRLFDLLADRNEIQNYKLSFFEDL